VTLAYFNLGPSDEFDDHAIDFVKGVRRQLHAVSSLPPDGPIPFGPQFDYALGPGLFSGRVGTGPLVVVWDTNIVIDYLTHGRSLWWLDAETEEFANSEDGHLVDLELLRMVLAVWVTRSVDFVILQRSITDAKKELSQERRRKRAQLHLDFDEAIRLLADPDDGESDLYPASKTEIDKAIASAPFGADQELVIGAFARGAHVFLTRDQGILRAKNELRGIGLLPLTPADLFDELCACGAALAVWFPEKYVTWPLPDLARVGMIIRSFAPLTDPTRNAKMSSPAEWIMGRFAASIDGPAE
jgi:hypothetical protein